MYKLTGLTGDLDVGAMPAWSCMSDSVQDEYSKAIATITPELEAVYSYPLIYKRLIGSMSSARVASPLETPFYKLALWLANNEIGKEIGRGELVRRIAMDTGIKQSTVAVALFIRGFKKVSHLRNKREREQEDWVIRKYFESGENQKPVEVNKPHPIGKIHRSVQYLRANLPWTAKNERLLSALTDWEDGRNKEIIGSQAEYNIAINTIIAELDGENSFERVRKRVVLSMRASFVKSPLDAPLYKVALWLSNNHVPKRMSRKELIRKITIDAEVNVDSAISYIFLKGFKKVKHLCTEKELRIVKAMRM